MYSSTFYFLYLSTKTYVVVLIRVDSLRKGDKNNVRVASPERVFIPLKWTC